MLQGVRHFSRSPNITKQRHKARQFKNSGYGRRGYFLRKPELQLQHEPDVAQAQLAAGAQERRAVNLAVVHVAAVSRIQIHQLESTVAAHQPRVLRSAEHTSELQS